MAGSVEGGRKTREKNLAKDPEYYSKLGKKGAAAYKNKPRSERLPRGFEANPDLARRAGAKGGAISKRGKSNAKD